MYIYTRIYIYNIYSDKFKNIEIQCVILIINHNLIILNVQNIQNQDREARFPTNSDDC